MENNQGDDASRSERGKRDFGAARGPRGDRGDRGDRGGFRGRDDRGGYGGPRGERGGFRGPRDDRGGFGGPRGERGGFRGPRDDRGERGGFRGPRDDRGERGGFRGPRDDRGERGGFGGPRGERGERGGFGGPRGERGGFRGPRDDRGERGGFGGPRGERGERGGFRGPRDDRGERGGFGGPRGERGGFRGPRDDRGERGGYGGPRGERGGFRGPRDDRGGFGGPRGERGGFRGPRDDRGERGGYGGPRGERGGFRGPRDDRGERGGYGGPRGERGGFRGPRDDRGERGGYGGPHGERGGFRGPRDERSDRGGERGERDRFRGPREEQAELAARPEETVAIPEDTTLDTTLDNNSPAIAESYEYEYGRSAASSQAAAQMSPDVDLTQQSLALDLDAKLPVVHINNPTWHPIIYRKRVDRVVGNPRPGQLVAVYHSETEQLGYGLFNPNAEILVRMLRLGIEAPDEAYWKQRLDEAIALRRDVLQLDRVTDSYRVVHAEADGLSGLVVDKLGDTLSAEVFSVGMWQRARAVMEYLVERFQAQHWLIRTGPYVLEQEGFAADPLASEQLPAQVTIQEFGTRFRVRFEGGHKTGFFCDQRDNRRQLASYCAGRSVLDLCCYSGGFSVQAKKLGEAAEVTGVDIDEQPLKLARENANLNQVRVNFVKEDAFAYMRDMLRNGRQYDVVVLDPPKLITSRRDLEEGTRKHFDMNRLAMQLVKPGGMLLTCSCAGLLSEEEFQKLLYSASRQAGPELPTVGPDGKRRHAPRAMQILGRSGAAPDHPVSANCREGEYLKAYWLRMM